MSEATAATPTSSLASVSPVAVPRASSANKPAAPPAKAAPASVTVPPRAPATNPTPVAATDTSVWGDFFRNWMEGVPQRGIVVNQLNEAIPFKGFMVRGETVLLQRTGPDSLGARFVVTPFVEIAMVKLTDPLKQEAFDRAGYKGKLSG